MSGSVTSRLRNLLRFDGLWRHPDFVRLWTGETISEFGSLIGRTALHFTAILVLDARPYQVALLLAADIGSGVLVGPVAGVWVDRLRRRPILIAADLGRAALLASIPVAYALDALRMEQLYLVACLTGAMTMTFEVAYRSYLPSLVGREELLEGNSKLTASSAAAEVGAFGAAGWLVQILTGPVAILLDAVSFLFSAFFVGAIRKQETEPPPAHEREGVMSEITEGLKVIMRHRTLRAIAGGEFLNHFSFAMFGAVFGLYVIRELDFQPGILGMIYAVGGASSLIGALVAGRVASRFGIGPAMVYGLAIMGVAMLAVPLARDATLLAAALLLAQQLFGDGAFTVYSVNEMTLRQTITPDRLLGRVNAGMETGPHAVMLVGALAGGLLGELIGLRATLVIAACVMLLAALWLAASPVRALRSVPLPAPELEPEPAVPLAEPGPALPL
jgi:MFS family permease